jgi:hypothetical protein
MRRIFVSVLLAAAFSSTALAGGCSGGKNGIAGDASADAYGVHVTGDGAGSDGEGEGGGDSMGEQTTMRLAHASPDLGPIDFCWRSSGAASFTGPVLGGDQPADAGAPAGDGGPDGPSDAGSSDGADARSDAGDGHIETGIAETGTDETGTAEAGTPETGAPESGTPETGTPTADAGAPQELVFGTMTPDVLLPAAGTFDIAIVAAGQTSCATRRLAGTVTLDAGKRATVVLMGLAALDSGADALSIVAFTDAPLDPQTARVRMIHAALGATGEAATGPLSVRAGNTPVATEVDPTMASAPSTAPAVDALGYTTLPPLMAPTTLQLATVGDVAGAQWTTAGSDLAAQAGTSHTGIIVTLGQGALGIAWCGDAPTNRGPATCAVLLAQP